MHIVSKFQFFIHIFTIENLKIRSQHFKGRQKWACLCNLFQLIYISELTSYKLRIYVKIMLIILSIIYLKILRLLRNYC